MAFPRIPDDEKARPLGISIDQLTISRLDVLMGVRRRERSERYRELLVAGIEARFGKNWREIADAMREREGVAA